MAHAQKPDFVFRRNGRVHLNRRGRQFSRLLAAEVCVSAVVVLDTPRSEVVSRVLATHSIRQFPLQFPSCASPRAITCQLKSTISYNVHLVKSRSFSTNKVAYSRCHSSPASGEVTNGWSNISNHHMPSQHAQYVCECGKNAPVCSKLVTPVQTR